MHHLVSAFCLAFVAFNLVAIVKARLSERRRQIKANSLGCQPPRLLPNKLPFGIDHVRAALAAVKNQTYVDHLTERTQKAGVPTYQTNVLGNRIIITAEPKNVQALLATQFSDFCLGQARRGILFPLLGNGIFTQDGQEWSHSRSMLRPQFAREQISDLQLEERHLQNLMRALKTNESSGWTGETDLQVLFFRLTLDSATEFLFGESADSQIVELPENKAKQTTKKPTARDEAMFAKAFDISQQACATRLRLSDKYWLYNPAAFKRSNKICHDFIDHYVHVALKCRPEKSGGRDGEKSEDTEKYVFLEELATQMQDPIELRSQLLNVLLAGRDTTASLLGWLFYLLARRPQIWDKLRATIIDTFGTYRSDEDITFVKIKDCQYLQYCLNETLRLFPVVPNNLRFATKDTTLPLGGGPDSKSPIFIEKGGQVDYSVHVMQRRQDLWGRDADDFRPERWVSRKPGWEYLPFNGGPRICLGQQFSLTEASYIVIRLLQRFDRIKNLDPHTIPKHNFTLTNCSARGVVVRLHEADS